MDATQRLPLVDALRGFALFGILVVNVQYFAVPFGSDPMAAAAGPVDAVAVWLTRALFESKFYVLFSFLFGFGLAVQIERAREDPAPLRGRYLRRMLGLLVLGVLHGLLVFAGDILVSYALVGLLLWRLRSWDDWRLERFGLGVITVACVLGALIGTSFAYAPEAAPAVHPAAAAAGSVGFGERYGASLEQRLEDLALVYTFSPLITWPAIFAMFVFGLAAGRARAFGSFDALLELARLRWGTILAIAVAGNILYASFGRGGGNVLLSGLAFGLLPIAGPLLALIYVRGVWAWFERHRESLLARALEAAGRLSLTNYLMQSVVCALLLESFGLDLGLRPAALLALAVALFTAQLAFSLIYLRFFRLGPAEWLLRKLTYG